MRELICPKTNTRKRTETFQLLVQGDFLSRHNALLYLYLAITFQFETFFFSHFVTVGIPIVTNLTQFVTFLCIHSVPCYLYLSYAYSDSYFLVFRVFGNLGKED